MIKTINHKELKKLIKKAFGWRTRVVIRNRTYLLYGYAEICACLASVPELPRYEKGGYDCKYQADEILVGLRRQHPLMCCCYVKGVSKSIAHAWVVIIGSEYEMIHVTTYRSSLGVAAERGNRGDRPYIDEHGANQKKYPHIECVRF